MIARKECLYWQVPIDLTHLSIQSPLRLFSESEIVLRSDFRGEDTPWPHLFSSRDQFVNCSQDPKQAWQLVSCSRRYCFFDTESSSISRKQCIVMCKSWMNVLSSCWVWTLRSGYDDDVTQTLDQRNKGNNVRTLRHFHFTTPGNLAVVVKSVNTC